jgi:hypothetical protein
VNNRGLANIRRRGMSHADVQRLIVESLERPRPEHDGSGARLLRGAFEREVGL